MKKDENSLIILIKNKKDLKIYIIPFCDYLVRKNKSLLYLLTVCHHELMDYAKLTDVVLDSYFFGGDTTTREAFEIGAPIVTLPDNYLGSRWTYAYYKIMNINELIASDKNNYVEIAIQLANNKQYSLEMRQKIKTNSKKLFKSNKAVSNWEESFIQIKNKYNKQFLINQNTSDKNVNRTIEKKNKNILFSCTAFFKNEDKFKNINTALDTFLKYNKNDLDIIDKFIIVVEFSTNNKLYMDTLKKKYPFIDFIEKKPDEKGQSKSINIIHSYLKKFKYWLHWEDSWFSTSNFLRRIFNIMEKNSIISNLQLTKREIFYNLPLMDNEWFYCRLNNNNNIKIIQPKKN